MRALLKLILFLLIVLALLAIAPAAAAPTHVDDRSSIEVVSALPPPPTNTPPLRWRWRPEKPRHWRRYLVPRPEGR